MLSRGRQMYARSMFCALLCATLPTACSTVPSPGPSRSALIDDATHADAPYLLVPISDFAIEHLAHFPGPSLYGKFGDYRKAVKQIVGVGDTLDVTIFEAAGGGLFSQPIAADQQTGSHSAQLPSQIVERDGSITVPYAGRVNVVGLTTPEIEKVIVQRLTGKAIEPQVVVTLSQNLSTSVTVTGEVVKGERVPLSARGDRLLDVIADAGGINAPANESFIELMRDGKTLRVPFQTLVNDPKENIFARPGDTLTVVRYPLTFTAVGATLLNAVVNFDAVGISLEEAIGKAAGLVDVRADPEGVFVLRYEPVSIARGYPGITPAQAALDLVPVVYLINMRDPNALFLARRFSIHDKDIVYVSNSPFSDLEKLFGLISSLEAPAVQGISVGSSLKTGNTNNATGLISGAAPTVTSTQTAPTTTR